MQGMFKAADITHAINNPIRNDDDLRRRIALVDGLHAVAEHSGSLSVKVAEMVIEEIKHYPSQVVDCGRILAGFQMTEEQKMALVRSLFENIDEDDLTDGETFFRDLNAGKYDDLKDLELEAFLALLEVYMEEDPETTVVFDQSFMAYIKQIAKQVEQP